MKTPFFTFLIMSGKAVSFFVDGNDSGSYFSFDFENLEIEENETDILKIINETTKKRKTNRFDSSFKSYINVIQIPDYLLSAAVFGNTENGSLKAGKYLAKTMLLNTKKTFLSKDINENSDINLSEIDVVIITGGYNDSESDGVRKTVSILLNNESLKKSKPVILFAGSIKDIPFVKVQFSPIADFINLDNVIEKFYYADSLILGETLSAKKTISFLQSTIQAKMQNFSFSNVLQKICEIFCGRYVNKTTAVLITKNYSVVNECEKAYGKPSFKRYGIYENDVNLKTSVFTESFLSFMSKSDNFSDDGFLENDLLSIEKKESKNYYSPDRIIGISLSDNINMDKFIDLISDPDLIRGVIEFLFDSKGAFLAVSPEFFDKTGDFSDILLDISNNDFFISGWLVVPEGDFVKDSVCMKVYISGNEEKKEMNLSWGKRYIINIEPFSVVEFFAVEKNSFKGERKKILKAGKTQRTLVVDVRKEKS